jgi:hypothetical protein
VPVKGEISFSVLIVHRYGHVSIPATGRTGKEMHADRRLKGQVEVRAVGSVIVGDRAGILQGSSARANMLTGVNAVAERAGHLEHPLYLKFLTVPENTAYTLNQGRDRPAGYILLKHSYGKKPLPLISPLAYRILSRILHEIINAK